MLIIKERRATFRTIEGWARSVLLDAGAIRECEEHGWAKDHADPHAQVRPPHDLQVGRSGTAAHFSGTRVDHRHHLRCQS